MKRVRILGISLMIAMFLGCSSDNSPATSYSSFTANLTGVQETPANASTGTGTATLSYNNSTKVLSMTLYYTGITPDKGGHIHKGAVGVAGDIIFGLTITPSPIMFVSPALTAQQESDLKNGLYYVNLHTTAYPDGEIRGQILPASGTTTGGGGGGGGGGGY